jgi:hypothetical protein
MTDDGGCDVRRARAVQSEFEQNRDDDLGLVGRGEADEPSMVRASSVLRSTSLASQRKTLNRGRSGGSTRLEHRFETFENY